MRQTVASLTLTPLAAKRNSALWEWVAHGLNSRSSASSLVAFSSSLGYIAGSLPGLQGAALVEVLTVAFDPRSVNTETAGGLGLGDALFDRLDDLLS